MLKPVMNKLFITIILSILCLLVSSPVAARLTLGVVAGMDEAAGEITSDQASSLARLLTEQLQEEVVVKELSDFATVVNWLDRFAALDLALLSAEEVKANRGKFLLVGRITKQGNLNLVVRQGIAGDLPQRAARIVRESGFVPWRSSETIVAPAKPVLEESLPFVASESVSIDEVITAQAELQHVPSLSPGRAWDPQRESVYRDLLPSDEPLAEKLVLGVVPDPKGLLQTSEQARRLAAYLEQTLSVTVKVREFTRLETFTEWFTRYRMVDFAVLSPAVAKEHLGRAYQPIATLSRTDKLDSTGLVVMRRGQNEGLQAPLQRAFLDLAQAADGRALLTILSISEVFAPVAASAPDHLVDQASEPVIQVKKPSLELAVERVEKILPPISEYAEPVESVAPPEVVVKALPELPEVAGSSATLMVAEVSDVVLILPEPATKPVVPAQPVMAAAVKSPGMMVGRSEPLPPEMPLLPTIVASVSPPDLTAVVKPLTHPVDPSTPAVGPTPQRPAVELVQIASTPLPEEPVLAVVPATLPAAIALVPVKPVEIPVAPEVPVAPVVETVATVPSQLPEKPVLVALPPAAIALEPVTPVEVPVAPEGPVAPAVEPVAVVPVQVPEKPVFAVVPATPPAAIALEPVMPVEAPAAPEGPVAPAVEPVAVVPVQLPEKPALAAAPTMLPAEIVLDPVTPVEVPVTPVVPVPSDVEPIEVASIPAPEEPVIVAAPVLSQEGVIPKSLEPQKVEQPEIKIVVTDVAPGEPELPVDIPIDLDIGSGAVAGKESPEDEQQKIIEEVMTSAEVVPAHDLTEESPVFIDDKTETLPEDEVIAILGENTVVAMVAQPDIPQELRPAGIPVVRPGRLPRRSTAEEDELLVASMPAPLKNTAPARLPNFLPKLEPEPGIVYIVPFVAIMVPNEVQVRIFDLFVDLLNQEGEALGLQFVILKSRLQDVAPEWLASRKYVTGEIYAYVEETGSSWTEIRSKTRVTYRRPDQESPAFGFEYPIKTFFDHDHSSLDVERSKLADKVAMTLADELLKALKN